ncbi:MAG: di-trans,poly-cis-decaprenylcistransferase [Clostridia bacterium]|nr:di-trans,poly-cis-decaprenylcistransferase [Clostridia bacterium]
MGNELRHIAFIMDGNGRWAKKRHLPREFGHRAGVETFRRVLTHCRDLGIPFITVYAFSTENWKRPQHEVDALMDLLSRYLRECLRDAKKNKARFCFIGDPEPLSDALKAQIRDVESATSGYDSVVNIALNYGSRHELVQAFEKLVREGKTEFTEEDVDRALYTAHCPDPDLIVRTAGEKRLSNFLLWQAAYAEFYFTDTLWPDLSNREIDSIVADYSARVRRYGAVKEEPSSGANGKGDEAS